MSDGLRGVMRWLSAIWFHPAQHDAELILTNSVRVKPLVSRNVLLHRQLLPALHVLLVLGFATGMICSTRGLYMWAMKQEGAKARLLIGAGLWCPLWLIVKTNKWLLHPTETCLEVSMK